MFNLCYNKQIIHRKHLYEIGEMKLNAYATSILTYRGLANKNFIG